MTWFDKHEIGLTFLIHLGLYLAISILLNMIGFYTPQSLHISEKAMISTIGLEPKLANIGFVNPPLPFLLATTLGLFTLLKGFLFIPKLLSSLMASALLALIHEAMREEGLDIRQRLSLLASFSLNPLFVYCATSGDETSTYFFFYSLFLFSAINMLERKRLHHLFYAGLGLGGAFLSQYEAVLLGLFSIPFLHLVIRGRNDYPSERAGLVYLSLYLPIIYAALAWIGINWTIMGDPFYFIRGPYSLATTNLVPLFQNPTWGQFNDGPIAAYGLALHGLLAVSPLYIALAFFIKSHALIFLALPFVIYGLELFLLGPGSIPFTNYLIVHLTAFPLALYLQQPSRGVLGERRILIGLVLVSLLVSVPSTFYWMDKFPLGNLYEREFREILFFAEAPKNHREEKEIAAYLREKVGTGKLILLDNLMGYPIIALSQMPKAFITPGHSLFLQALENPRAYKIDYILVPDPQKPPAQHDSINIKYPNLFLERQKGVTPEKAFQSWKLFRVGAHG